MLLGKSVTVRRFTVAVSVNLTYVLYTKTFFASVNSDEGGDVPQASD